MYSNLFEEMTPELRLSMLQSMGNPGFLAGCEAQRNVFQNKLDLINPDVYATSELFKDEWIRLRDHRDFWAELINLITKEMTNATEAYTT